MSPPLRAFLARHRRIALNPGVFICHLKANPSCADLTATIFTRLER